MFVKTQTFYINVVVTKTNLRTTVTYIHTVTRTYVSEVEVNASNSQPDQRLQCFVEIKLLLTI